MDGPDPLRVRLFGYGVLYQARFGAAGEVQPVVTDAALFARQRELLTPQVVERIRFQDAAVFRFPGMFGGIATLFNALT